MASHFGSLGWSTQRVEGARCIATGKGKAGLGRPREAGLSQMASRLWMALWGTGREWSANLHLHSARGSVIRVSEPDLCFFSWCAQPQGQAFEQARTGVSAPLLSGSVMWAIDISLSWSLGFLTHAALYPNPFGGFVSNPDAQEDLRLSLCPCPHARCR